MFRVLYVVLVGLAGAAGILFSAGVVGGISASLSPAYAQFGPGWPATAPAFRKKRRVRRSSRRRALSRNRSRRSRIARSKKRAPVRMSLPKRSADSAAPQIVVSLSKQRMTVYEGGRQLATSRVSTGKRGYETPRGIFSIIHKRRHHYSNIYRGAAMPFMQRLTWSGIALHQGVVPNYPASHGCIRLPGGFARSLFGYTERRTHVIVSRDNPKPEAIASAKLFQPQVPVGEPKTGEISKKKPVRLALNLAGEEARTTDAPMTSVGSPREPEEQRSVETPSLLTSDPSLAFPQLKKVSKDKTILQQGPSTSPLRMLITRRPLQIRTKRAQRLLSALGYDVGEPDGVTGKQTVKAVKEFQMEHGLPATGVLNEEFFAELYRITGQPADSLAMILIRQDQKQVYSAPVQLKHPEAPIGAHLYTLTTLDPVTQRAGWHAITAATRGRIPGTRLSRDERDTIVPVDASTALERIDLPEDVRAWIEKRITKGSSLIISDGGHARETGLDTDFIVLTR